MGGPASLFTWAFGFDPVAWIAQVAAACSNLLYVDDLLGQTRGPGQTLLLYLALLAATKLASLKVEDHSCVTVAGPDYHSAVALLRAFLVQLHEGEHSCFSMSEGPVEIYRQILIIGGDWSPNDLQIYRRECRCKTKHGLVPAGAHAQWAAALAHMPLTAAITGGTRFLGAHLCSKEQVGERPSCFGFTSAAISACVDGTYRRCLSRTTSRTTELCEARLSLANRSDAWNTFCVATVPYPASVLPISPTIAEQLRGELGKFFSCGTWIKRCMITDLGMALGLRGTPRDPGLVADTASLLSLARGGLAGPEEGHSRILCTLREVKAWVSDREVQEQEDYDSARARSIHTSGKVMVLPGLFTR